jgi:predicted ester cyclase
MSTKTPAQRIELSPAVRAILAARGPQSELLQCYLRYLQALLDPDPAGLEHTVTANVRCHLLDTMGLPPGRDGLKIFRHQINAAIPDEHITVTAVSFEGENIIEVDMVMTATQTGELLGIPATGRKVRFEVHERCRFAGGKLAERQERVDLEDIKRQLTSPI